MERIQFPSGLKRKLTSRINKPIKVVFYNGSSITIERFNIAIVDPFKAVFTRNNKHVVVFIVPKESEGTTAYEFFVEAIDKTLKSTMTAVISFVNSNL